MENLDEILIDVDSFWRELEVDYFKLLNHE